MLYERAAAQAAGGRAGAGLISSALWASFGRTTGSPPTGCRSRAAAADRGLAGYWRPTLARRCPTRGASSTALRRHAAAWTPGTRPSFACAASPSMTAPAGDHAARQVVIRDVARTLLLAPEPARTPRTWPGSRPGRASRGADRGTSVDVIASEPFEPSVSSPVRTPSSPGRAGRCAPARRSAAARSATAPSSGRTSTPASRAPARPWPPRRRSRSSAFGRARPRRAGRARRGPRPTARMVGERRQRLRERALEPRERSNSPSRS